MVERVPDPAGLPAAAIAPATGNALASRASESAPVLRVLLCGSVADGKSTLIGRLLHGEGPLMSDTLTALKAESARLQREGANCTSPSCPMVSRRSASSA